MYKIEDEEKLLIALAGTNEVAEWDAQQDELVRLVSLTDGSGNTCVEPRSLVYTEPGFIWVACFAGHEVWVLDAETEEVVEKVSGTEGAWEMDHSNAEAHNWIVVSNWGGEVGPWDPSEPGDRSGTVTILEADPNDEDFGTRVPESELPGEEASNPIELPSTDDGGPWGASACEGIFFITKDDTDTTFKLTLDPFALEIFDKGELPWEVDCRSFPDGPLRVLIPNGGDDTPPSEGSETKTVDGPMRDRNGDPVETSFTTFPERENPHACWDTIFNSWSDHQKEKYFNHTELPWWNEDNPSFGSAEYARARGGTASFDLISIFENGECKYQRFPVGEDSPPDAIEPWGVDIGPDSKVYMVDMHANLTREFDPDTGSMREFESQCYEAPRDIAVLNDKLYVVGTGNHTISSQEDGEPNEYDYTDAEGPGGLEWFDLEDGTHHGCDPLPVELASFEGTVTAEGVRLSWQTATETGNAGFEVQRRAPDASAPGARKAGGEEAGWRQVGFVEPKAEGGTTNQTRSYRFTDEKLPYADRLEYRLRQVDLDGTATLTDPVVVERSVEEPQLKKAFPNPARGQATVRFALPERQEVRLELYDVMGRQVRTVVHSQKEGRHEETIDVSGLPSGTYFVRLRSGGNAVTDRLTVVR